jgi:hypothetical protein
LLVGSSHIFHSPELEFRLHKQEKTQVEFPLIEVTPVFVLSLFLFGPSIDFSHSTGNRWQRTSTFLIHEKEYSLECTGSKGPRTGQIVREHFISSVATVDITEAWGTLESQTAFRGTTHKELYQFDHAAAIMPP